MTGKSLREITAEIRANNVARGWRPAGGGPGENTFGDYVALLHTEVAEMTETYRDWGTRDATEPLAPQVADGGELDFLVEGQDFPIRKPEGVGSELADVFIRTLDMADVFGYRPFDMDCEIGDIDPNPPIVVRAAQAAGRETSFGDWMWGLHNAVGDAAQEPTIYFPSLLRTIAAVAERYEIDLTAEYERKMAYNRTRPFQHGGRTMAKIDGGA